jgi:transposase
MGYIEGEDRKQIVMFPDSLEDYIREDNAVRFVGAFVESLDLEELGFQRAVPNQRGRNAYHPGMLLALYIYGYLNRIRSSRKLERETERNVELMWLMRKLTPDHKTIADFRKDNLAAIAKVCRQFKLLCKEMGLFGGELIGVDGSKFRAVNSKERSFNAQKLERAMKRVDRDIEEYLRELDECDREESGIEEVSAEELKEKIEKLKKRRAKYEQIGEKLSKSEDGQVSLTDPDSRLMKSRQGTHSGYNAQIGVDSKHKLIAAEDLSGARSDRGQLTNIATQAKEVLGVSDLNVVADMGYYDCEDIKNCEKESITAYVSKPAVSRNAGLFIKEDFVYDTQEDVYVCPEGEKLKYVTHGKERERGIRYYMNREACSRCPLKTRCTRGAFRRIKRLEHEGVMETMAERVRGHPERMRLRKELVEHPFGTIKRGMDQGYFLMKTVANVGTELKLATLAYNMKRVINIVGVKKMIEALG